MLNYNELGKKLDALLKSQTKEDLESWLEMDRERMFFAFKNKEPQTFANRPLAVVIPTTDQSTKNLLTFEQVFLF